MNVNYKIIHDTNFMNHLPFVLIIETKNICSYLSLGDIKNLRLITKNSSKHIFNYMIKNYYFIYDKELLDKNFKLKN